MSTGKKTCFTLFVWLFFFSSQALADEFSLDKYPDSENISIELENDEESVYHSTSDYAYYGDLWRPIVSIVMPGFDQYLNKQYSWGLGYTVTSLGAFAWYLDASKRKDQFEETDEFMSASEAKREDWNYNRYGIYREQDFALRLALSAAFMSGYHSFKTAVRSRKRLGEYEFLDMKYEESPQEILTAPFNFSYLKRPTTWGWIAFKTVWVAALSVYAYQIDDWEQDPYTFEDAAYNVGFPYLCGTVEETTFEGIFLPALREYTGSYFAANIIKSCLFTALHSPSSITAPFFSYYMGWLTKRNNWQIGESVFIHFWTDAIALAITYSLRRDDASAQVMMLPLISFSF